MFHNLPPEINIHLFSFLTNKTIALCSTVNKSSNHIANAILERQVKDVNIGRATLKKLCLANPKIAKIGIQADANRIRYLLLVNDLCEIGCANEEVALFMIGCNRLHSRLNRNCLNEFSMTYPKVAQRIVNMTELRGALKKEDIVKIITKYPELFDSITQHQIFIQKLSHQVVLQKLSRLNENMALKIIRHPILKNEVYINSLASVDGSKYLSIALAILRDEKLYSGLDGDDIKKLGDAHIEAAELIIENPDLCEKLKDKELQSLQDKVIGHIMSLSSI